MKTVILASSSSSRWANCSLGMLCLLCSCGVRRVDVDRDVIHMGLVVGVVVDGIPLFQSAVPLLIRAALAAVGWGQVPYDTTKRLPVGDELGDVGAGGNLDEPL